MWGIAEIARAIPTISGTGTRNSNRNSTFCAGIAHGSRDPLHGSRRASVPTLHTAPEHTRRPENAQCTHSRGENAQRTHLTEIHATIRGGQLAQQRHTPETQARTEQRCTHDAEARRVAKADALRGTGEKEAHTNKKDKTRLSRGGWPGER